jgi:dynein light intermediate chain, axonemal
LIAEQKKMDLDVKIKQLQATNKDLRSQVENLKKSIESTITRTAEKRQAEENAHNEEVERLHRTNDQLKSSLETLLSAPRK